MGARVTVRTLGGLRVEASNGQATALLDEGPAVGGEGKGLAPHEALLSALGGCTSMTLLLYARRKGWALEGVEIDVAHEAPPGGAGPARIVQQVRLRGALDDAQRARLLEVAGKCPVHKTLSGDLELVESLA